MNFIFIGPPGSGKSTQAELLAKKLNFYYLQMGSVVREIAQEPTELGKRIKSQMENKGIVEDEAIKKILRQKILTLNKQVGLLLDGALRRKTQIDDVQQFFDQAGRKIDKVILIEVSDRECLKRLLLRKRIDDNEELIKKRLADYHQLTDPIIDYYRQKKLLLEIDGERPIEVIHRDILEKLNM